MRLSREEVKRIALLARVGMTEDDVDRMSGQLSNILENFEILRTVETSDVPPTAQAIALQGVMRNDEIAPSMAPDQVLANAPRQESGFFKVNAVLEE